MRMSQQVGTWIDEELQDQLVPGEDAVYDCTMAPTGGGPNGDAPFLAVVLALKLPGSAEDQLNFSQFYQNFAYLDASMIRNFVTEGLTQLRDVRDQGFANDLKNSGSSPGRLYLPDRIYLPGEKP